VYKGIANYENFQKDNVKYCSQGIIDIYNPDGFSFEKDDKELDKFKQIKNKWKSLISFWRVYPDHLAKLYGINLYGYQILLLRAMFRYRYVYIVATRGAAKTFVSLLGLILQCILFSRVEIGVTAGGKAQATSIFRSKVEKFKEDYPLLMREVKKITDNKDNYTLYFHNGSSLKVALAGESSRGLRFSRLLADENRLIKTDVLNTILIPTLVIKRQLPNGTTDENELNHQQIYLTSAYFKNHDCYKKFLSFTKDMLSRGNTFVCAFDYHVPILYGLFDEEYIEELKQQDDFNPLTFKMEYEASFLGVSENAFFNLDEISQCRVHKLPELKRDEKIKDKDIIYVAGIDIARQPDRKGKWDNDLTCITVLKCTPRSDNTYTTALVYIRTLQGMHFQEQANIIRHLIDDYGLCAIAIDVKGLSGGILDWLNIPYYDPERDKEYKPIVSMNDDIDKSMIQNGALPLIYKVNPTAQLNSDMYVSLQSAFRNKKIRLLVDEQEGKKELEKIKKLDVNTEILLKANFIETSALVNELMNLEYSMNGTLFKVEPASRSIRKDRVSSLIYSNMYVRLLGEENKRNQNQEDEFYCLYN
jgi:hypothetical protein